MAIYEYKALDQTGKMVRGTLDADSVKTVKQKLKKNNLVLTELSEKNVTKKASEHKAGFSLFGRVKLSDVALITRQLASLIRANIPLVEALTALTDQTENPKLRSILSTVKQEVNEGNSLARAISKHPRAFNNVFVNMIEAGETSGTLPLVLIRLAEFQESQVKLASKITSALMYPILMMITSFGLIIGIFTFVIPKIVVVFTSMNKELPLQTKVVIALSNFLVNYWWLILIIMVVTFIALNRYISTQTGRRVWDSIKLKLPIIGPLIRMIAVARFSNTMATLLTGGVPIITAMNIVKNIVANTLIMEAIAQARENVTEGQSIALPLKKSQQFPPLVIHMITIGEKTGELPQMLQNVASTYEEQVAVKIEGFTALLEPAMIIFMGVVVGGVVASIFVPLIELNNIN